jgi:hypothetical protein
VGIEGLALGLGDGLLEGCEVAEPLAARVERGLLAGELGLGSGEGGGFGDAGLAILGGQRRLVGELQLEAGQGVLLGLHALVGELRELAVGLGAGEGLQQLGALVVGGLQEGGEVVLGEQHGAGELLEAEADALLDGLQGFLLVWPPTSCPSARRVRLSSVFCSLPPCLLRARRTVQRARQAAPSRPT